MKSSMPEHASSVHLLSEILQGVSAQKDSPHNALEPSGVFAVVAALLGIQTQELCESSMVACTRAGIPDDIKLLANLAAAEKKAAAAKALVKAFGGTNVPGCIAAIVAGPSLVGFARHCWEALEGASSGECPFVGAHEYAVLEAFDLCVLALTDLYDKFSQLHAIFVSPHRKLPLMISHVPFLKGTSNSD